MGFTEIIGLALAAAGAATSMSAASSAKSNMNKEALAQLKLQEDFKKQAKPVYEESLRLGSPDVARQVAAEGASAAEGRYKAVAGTPGGTSPLPVDEQRVQGIVGPQRQAYAQQQGYSDVALQQWLKNQQASSQLGVISNLASSASGNSGILTQLAGQKSAGQAGLGSLLSTAGNLAAIYGGVNQRRALSTQPTPLVDKTKVA